jgi:hypothetical protein
MGIKWKKVACFTSSMKDNQAKNNTCNTTRNIFSTLQLNIKLSTGTAIFNCLISIGDKVKHVESV